MALTYANIETRVMNQLRVPTSNTTEQAKIQALINECYRDIYAKHDWWWAVKRTIVNTVAEITTGTVSTNGTTTVTFSTGPTPSVAGYKLNVTGNTTDFGAVYRVSTHVALAATAVLDAAYTGEDETAAAYHLWKDTYSLPAGTTKLLRVNRWGYAQPLELIGPDEMASLKENDLRVGKPQAATLDDFSTSGDPTTVRQMVVWPYPDATYRLEVQTKQGLNTELSGATEPLIPDDYRQILIYGALARGYPIFLNDTTRGKYFQDLFNDTLLLMTATQTERASDRPRIQIRDQYRSFYTRGRRVTPANVNLGSLFDRWPAVP